MASGWCLVALEGHSMTTCPRFQTLDSLQLRELRFWRGIDIVLKAGFDTGNHFDSTQFNIVTLAGVSGLASAVDDFEDAWLALTRKHWLGHQMPNVQPFLHTTDLVSGSDPFLLASGWDDKSVMSFLVDCAAILADSFWFRRLHGLSVSIILADYKKAVQDGLDVVHIKDRMGSWAIASAVLPFSTEFVNTGAVLSFDSGEPFEGPIRDRWIKEKRRKFAWSKIIGVGEYSMIDIPLIQAADLLAWAVNKSHEGYVHGSWQQSLLSAPRDSQMLDEKTMRNPDPEELKRFNELKLPKRKITP